MFPSFWTNFELEPHPRLVFPSMVSVSCDREKNLLKLNERLQFLPTHNPFVVDMCLPKILSKFGRSRETISITLVPLHLHQSPIVARGL